MFKYALISALLVIPAWSVDAVSNPPACLSGPVMKETVTLTCTAIDNSAPGITSDGFAYGYLLQLKATSTDPDVMTMRFTVTTSQLIPGNPTPYVTVRSVSPNKIAGAFTHTFQLPVTTDQNSEVVPISITSIQVHELKASSSQTF